MALEKGFGEISEIKDPKIRIRFRHFSHLNHQIEICEYTREEVFKILNDFDDFHYKNNSSRLYLPERDYGLFRHILNCISEGGKIYDYKFKYLKYFLECKFDPFFLSEKRFGILDDIQDLEQKAKFEKFRSINNQIEICGITLQEIMELKKPFPLLKFGEKVLDDYYTAIGEKLKGNLKKDYPEFIDRKNNGLYVKIYNYLYDGGSLKDLDEFLNYKFGLD